MYRSPEITAALGDWVEASSLVPMAPPMLIVSSPTITCPSMAWRLIVTDVVPNSYITTRAEFSVSPVHFLASEL